MSEHATALQIFINDKTCQAVIYDDNKTWQELYDHYLQSHMIMYVKFHTFDGIKQSKI